MCIKTARIDSIRKINSFFAAEAPMFVISHTHKHSLLFSMTNCFPHGHCSRPVVFFSFFFSFAFFICIHDFWSSPPSSLSCTHLCICVWVSKCINKSISKNLLCFVSSACFSLSLLLCFRCLCNVFAAAFFVASFT